LAFPQSKAWMPATSAGMTLVGGKAFGKRDATLGVMA
jgi:hypothetical protein